MNKNLLVLLTITILSGIALSSTFVSADDNEVIDTVELTVPVACTMSGTGTTHTATLNPGTYSGASGSEYENGIGKTTLTAICNDDNGFSIYAIGYTGDEYGVTNLIGSNTNGTIATKAYASGDTTSNWSMKLTKVTDTSESYNPQNLTISTGYDNWIAVPATYTKVAQYKANTGSSTTDTTLGVKLETTYAAYIASNQAADTYVGQVKYTMVHPYNTDSHGCNPNGNTIGEIICMQDVNSTNESTILASMTLEQQYTLKDKRDNKTYTVAKLKDNNIWMTQNLDLDLDSSITYTNEDTDIGYNTTTGEYDDATWSPSASTVTTDSEWISSMVSPVSFDPGNLYWNGVTSDGADWNTYTNTCEWDDAYYDCDESRNPISTYTGSTGAAQSHLGNYYNWAAAIATNDGSSYMINTDKPVEQSICPTGWTLPRTGDGDDSFQALWEEYNWDASSTRFTNDVNPANNPLYFIASGGYQGTVVYVGERNTLWSPVYYYNNYTPVAARIESNGLTDPSDWHWLAYNGYPIRCIARPVTNSTSGL